MGDRCYMQVTCRKCDADRFKQLGFVIYEEGELTVDMEDDYANYAHGGNLPDDIPWTGSNGSGDTYGPSDFACDGQELVEVECGHGGGYVIEWDSDNHQPKQESIQHLIHFDEVYAKARQMIGRP